MYREGRVPVRDARALVRKALDEPAREARSLSPEELREVGRLLGIPDVLLERLPGGGEARVEDRRNPWLGAPLRVRRAVVVRRAVSEDDVARALDAVRERIGDGAIERLGRTITFRAWMQGRQVSLSFERGEHETRVRADEGFAAAAGGLFGGLGGGLGGGMLGFIVPLASLAGLAWALPFAVPLWLLGVFLAARAVFARVVRGRIETLEAALERVVAALEEAPGRVRVEAAGAQRGEADDADAELEGGDEAARPRRRTA